MGWVAKVETESRQPVGYQPVIQVMDYQSVLEGLALRLFSLGVLLDLTMQLVAQASPMAQSTFAQLASFLGANQT